MKRPSDIRWRWWASLILAFGFLHALCWGVALLSVSIGSYIGPSQYSVAGVQVSYRAYRLVTAIERPTLLVSGVATLAVVVGFAREWSISLDRLDANCCPDCGYDLRASPERCPECGRPSKSPG